MITKIEIKNYRSIADATIKLAPFTLLIGANGSGKSNFLKLLESLSSFDNYATDTVNKYIRLGKKTEKHRNYQDLTQEVNVQTDGGSWKFKESKSFDNLIVNIAKIFPYTDKTKIFTLEPAKAGQREHLVLDPHIDSTGEGLVRVIDSLKTGDREDLFDKLEKTLGEFIPEIEKLSLKQVTNGKKLQVREKHLLKTTLVEELSEGTQLVLMILAIIYQENPPKLIGIEDIDRGLHPRLYQQVIELLRRITEERDVQIVATTHNPYLVDEFYEYEDSVVIVEKENGETTFTTLSDRLEDLVEEDESLEGALGSIWYSGMVGGVPKANGVKG